MVVVQSPNHCLKYLAVVDAFFSLAKTEFDYLLPILFNHICKVECK